MEHNDLRYFSYAAGKMTDALGCPDRWILRGCNAYLRAIEVCILQSLQSVDQTFRLGRLQGCFVQAASPSVETAQIAATTLEMLRAPQVHGHDQPYVRRCALIAASAVSSDLPFALHEQCN